MQTGIIPIELAAWLLVPVSLGLSGLATRWELLSPAWVQDLSRDFVQGGWGYLISYGVLVLLLTYFYKGALVPRHADNPAWEAGLFLVVIALLPFVLTRLSGVSAYILGAQGS